MRPRSGHSEERHSHEATIPHFKALGPHRPLLLAAMFILSGFGKLAIHPARSATSPRRGCPCLRSPMRLLLSWRSGAGILLVLGYQARWGGADPCSLHPGLGDPAFTPTLPTRTSMIHFMKNLAITGGFPSDRRLGAGAFSLDGRVGRANREMG